MLLYYMTYKSWNDGMFAIGTIVGMTIVCFMLIIINFTEDKKDE